MYEKWYKIDVIHERVLAFNSLVYHMLLVVTIQSDLKLGLEIIVFYALDLRGMSIIKSLDFSFAGLETTFFLIFLEII